MATDINSNSDASLPMGTVEAILDKAPSDLMEKVIDVPEWGCSVRIRSLTAAQSARIRQQGIKLKSDETKVAWAEMEILQFMEGVVEPKFDHSQVRKLHLTSSAGFNRVIQELDDLSNIDKEELREIRDQFQEQE